MPVYAILIIGYLVAINVAGFAMMGVDKRKARYNERRIPEADLFAVAALGGSLGAWAGMYAFRHKTQHRYFVVGMPAILAVQIIIAAAVLTALER